MTVSASQPRNVVWRAAVVIARQLDYNPVALPAHQAHNPVRVAITYLKNRSRFHAVANPYGIIQVDPRVIRWKLGGRGRSWALGSIIDGEWDLLHRHPIQETAKVVSMRQRFVLGFDWQDTDLFQRHYRQRIALGATVKGASTMVELAAHYRRVYDPLFERLQHEGFVTPTLRMPGVSLMHVHIARDGEILFTTGGNHRFGMAMVLGIPSIPVRVVVRHRSWQLVRDGITRGVGSYVERAGHPDLAHLSRFGP